MSQSGQQKPNEHFRKNDERSHEVYIYMYIYIYIYIIHHLSLMTAVVSPLSRDGASQIFFKNVFQYSGLQCNGLLEYK